MQATAKDLRFRLKELLEAVLRGEEVIITHRGKPRAKLTPIRDETGDDKAERKELFGIWRDHQATANVDEYVRALRKGRT